jgi:hypothetical protein
MQKLVRTELEGEMICLHARDKSQQNKKGSELFKCTYTDNVHLYTEGHVHVHLLAHLAITYQCMWHSAPVTKGGIRAERATNLLQLIRPESENTFKLTRSSGKN